MATYRVGEDVGLNIQSWIGLTADTTAFLAANTTFANGSTYTEVDGAQRKYKLLNGTWYQEIENVNLQVGDADVSASNTVPVSNSEMELISLGQNGGKAITGTGATTPDSGYYFAALQVISSTAVVAAQGDVDGVTNLDLTAFTSIPEGMVLMGQWDSIQLTSGEVAMYYGVV